MTTDTNAAQADTDAARTTAEAQVAAAKATADAAAAATAKAAAEAETTAKAAAEAQAKLPPEQYELQLPKDSLLEAAHVEQIAAFAKAQGLSQTQAQAILNRESQAAASLEASQATLLKDQAQTWLDTAAKDPEIGGEAFPRHAELTKRFTDTFGSEALRQALDATGLGNHPEFIRLAYRVAQTMTDDQWVTGKTTTTSITAEDKLYGKPAAT